MMDLKTIRTELHRLTAIVEGWEPGPIPALERDLALEKLRTLYDAVRFAAEESAAEAPAAEEELTGAAAVAIDLGAVLSLDPDGVGPEPAPEPYVAPGPAFDANPEPAFDAVPEPVEAFPEPDLTAEPGPAETFAEALAGAESGTMEPETGESGAVEPEPSEPDEPEIPDSGAVPEVEAGKSASEIPASEPVPAPEPAPAEKPHYIAPTLFGIEEETVRHRHKQRVIMSLYDTTAPDEKPARPEPSARPAERSVAAPEPSVKPAERPDVTPGPAAEPEPGIPGPQPAAEPVVLEPAPVPEPVALSAAEPEEEPESSEPEIAVPAGAVLGEVINHDVQTLADTIAPPRDVASELRRSEPVTDLRKAIGINDKFLLIRDLFGGDGEAYEKAVGTLNAFDDFDECMIYIAENYAWNPNSDGAKLMMELLERKFA